MAPNIVFNSTEPGYLVPRAHYDTCDQSHYAWWASLDRTRSPYTIKESPWLFAGAKAAVTACPLGKLQRLTSIAPHKKRGHHIFVVHSKKKVASGKLPRRKSPPRHA